MKNSEFKIVSSINYDEQEIIKNIIKLHGNGNYIDLDPTFSKGNFYKKGLDVPKYIFDKYPCVEGCMEADSANIPLPDNSCNIIMFDPPFVISGKTFNENKNGSSIIAKRFYGFSNFDELKKMYKDSLIEFKRLLNDDGIIIFKCQDTVSGGKQHMTHAWLIYESINVGLYPKDLFILNAKNRINSFGNGKWKNQIHARKYHSYYIVFQKSKNKVDYTV